MPVKKLKRRRRKGIDFETLKRLADIRRNNVERHEAHQSHVKLRENILRHQRNETLRMERDRLIATSQGNLSERAEVRIENIMRMINP